MKLYFFIGLLFFPKLACGQLLEIDSRLAIFEKEELCKFGRYIQGALFNYSFEEVMLFKLQIKPEYINKSIVIKRRKPGNESSSICAIKINEHGKITYYSCESNSLKCSYDLQNRVTKIEETMPVNSLRTIKIDYLKDTTNYIVTRNTIEDFRVKFVLDKNGFPIYSKEMIKYDLPEGFNKQPKSDRVAFYREEHNFQGDTNNLHIDKFRYLVEDLINNKLYRVKEISYKDSVFQDRTGLLQHNYFARDEYTIQDKFSELKVSSTEGGKYGAYFKKYADSVSSVTYSESYSLRNNFIIAPSYVNDNLRYQQIFEFENDNNLISIMQIY